MFVYFFCGQCAQPMASFHYSKILLNCQAIIFLAFDFRNYFVEEMNVYCLLFFFIYLSDSQLDSQSRGATQMKWTQSIDKFRELRRCFLLRTAEQIIIFIKLLSQWSSQMNRQLSKKETKETFDFILTTEFFLSPLEPCAEQAKM